MYDRKIAVAKFLQATRHARKLSLVELAAASGVDGTTCWRIESGETDPRFFTQLVPILSALGLDISDLPTPTTTNRK